MQHPIPNRQRGPGVPGRDGLLRCSLTLAAVLLTAWWARTLLWLAATAKDDPGRLPAVLAKKLGPGLANTEMLTQGQVFVITSLLLAPFLVFIGPAALLWWQFIRAGVRGMAAPPPR